MKKLLLLVIGFAALNLLVAAGCKKPIAAPVAPVLPNTPTTTFTLTQTPVNTPTVSPTPNFVCTVQVEVTPSSTYCLNLPARPYTDYYWAENGECDLDSWCISGGGYSFGVIDYSRNNITGALTSTANGQPNYNGSDRDYFMLGVMNYSTSVTIHVAFGCFGTNNYHLIIEPCLPTYNPITITGPTLDTTFVHQFDTVGPYPWMPEIKFTVVGQSGNPGPYQFSVWQDP